MIEATQPVPIVRPPRSMAWVLLLASAVAVLVTGGLATVVIFTERLPHAITVPPAFWPRLALAAGLTVAGINLRALRWIFLLRRADVRIPIRDAYIGYLAGFSLLLAPLFLGELGVRAWVLRRRGRVPTGVTAVLTLWERGFDLLALVTIGGLLFMSAGETRLAFASFAVVAVFLLSRLPRALVLSLLRKIVNRAGRLAGGRPVAPLPRLLQLRTSLVALAASLAAWTLPAAGFWLLVGGDLAGLAALDGMRAWVTSTLSAGLALIPGGIVMTGGQLLDWLAARGVAPGPAALLVLGSRLATVGVTTAFGALFLLWHVCAPHPISGDHFDAIAAAYDVQIPEARRLALLARKTTMMRRWIESHAIGRHGLDIGCGQGWYVGRMRELGFEVTGIDYSAGQVALAAQNLGDAAVVRVGSALAIPADDNSLDFAYSINVLHHLPSTEAQRDAFREIMRVLRPGGVLFVHEINTTNLLFRFYMGYVFPSMNCIDEGVERWLLPRSLSSYTLAPVVDVEYFTFFPDFMPQAIVRGLAPLERWLERSPLRAYSAHYMAVLRKPE